MGFKKASGRGRLDKYYHLAKEKGYRARAAFKLIQLNKKYHVLEKSHALLDLCAAPGSWCQVASEVMPPNSLIVGVDLAPIKPIPRCITFQSDITTDKCRATIRQHFKTLKADTVLHDGAPNVGTAWIQDAFTQAELVLQSLKLATEFLAPGGTFITKIFRSKDYNSLLWVFNQLFEKVEATKPPSSRNVSAEIFVVCREYKAPKRIDPRFLDSKSVFAELSNPTPNNEAKVFNPEKKKRKREGYEEGNWTQFKEAPVSDFIQTTDPIAMLGSLNRLSFAQSPNGDLALATLERLPETTEEVKNCCADLKVLGRSDFRLLLKWRLKIRDKFGMSQKQPDKIEAAAGDEVAQVEAMDGEMQLQEEMQRLKDQADSKKKKDRRKENERKQKEILRMQMNMTTPTDIGLDQAGPEGEDSMFALRNVEKAGVSSKFASGKMHTIMPKAEERNNEARRAEKEESEEDDDEEEDDLEGQLDAMYEEYQERKMEQDARYKAKKARKESQDEDFEGFSDKEVSSEDDIEENEDDSDDSSDGEEDTTPLFHKPGAKESKAEGLSQRAAMFFDQDLFKDIDGLAAPEHQDSGIDMEEDDSSPQQEEDDDNIDDDDLDDVSNANESPNSPQISKSKIPMRQKSTTSADDDSDAESNAGFEIVKQTSANLTTDPTVSEPTTKSGRPDVDIITAEAMTLAHALATGTQTKSSIQDDSFNKYSLRDIEGLPAWFLDDETEHSKPQKPVSAAAAAAIKEKLRALNARPIKKVREAKARKKFRAAQRLEKLKKKSALLVEDSDMSERDKASAVAKLMAKASKKKPKQSVKLVVAKGGNKGISGRPKGTKGRYKMVDRRMKKEKRAEKRVAAKSKKVKK